MGKVKGLNTQTKKALEGWSGPVGGGEILKWSKGLVVIGIFKEVRSSNGKFKDSNLFDMEVQQSGGELVFTTIGAPRILVSRLNSINRGEMIRIECLGKIPSANGQAWDFDVRKKKG